MFDLHPLVILAIAVVTVIGMIIVLRIHAFIALLTGALMVSLLAPGEGVDRVGRVAAAFGETAGKIGIVIALAAVIGKCLIDSGAADRVVRMFMGLLGEKRVPVSLMTSGFVLSVPVFFDTVFYLLLPLARSMHRKTGQRYLLLILAMGAGASITHSLVPPTPGPLIIADTLKIDLGMMIMMGLAVAIPTAVVMLFFVKWLSPKMDIPMRPIEGSLPEPEPLADDQLPGLFVSILPIILPVILISANTIVTAVIKGGGGEGWQQAAKMTVVFGNANLAMLISAAIALCVLYRQRKPSLKELSTIVETSLMSAGVIILITSSGGAFGAMLKEAQIGDAIEKMFTTEGGASIAGIKLLLMGFFVAFLLKFAQGSSTVSMITTSAMMGSLILSPEGEHLNIGFHPVYVAAAIGFGAQCGNWMNDSGFWIFAKMGGLTEVETLKTWTVTISTLAVVGLVVTIIFATILPMA